MAESAPSAMYPVCDPLRSGGQYSKPLPPVPPPLQGYALTFWGSGPGAAIAREKRHEFLFEIYMTGMIAKRRNLLSGSSLLTWMTSKRVDRQTALKEQCFHEWRVRMGEPEDRIPSPAVQEVTQDVDMLERSEAQHGVVVLDQGVQYYLPAESGKRKQEEDSDKKKRKKLTNRTISFSQPTDWGGPHDAGAGGGGSSGAGSSSGGKGKSGSSGSSGKGGSGSGGGKGDSGGSKRSGGGCDKSRGSGKDPADAGGGRGEGGGGDGPGEGGGGGGPSKGTEEYDDTLSPDEQADGGYLSDSDEGLYSGNIPFLSLG